MEVAAQHTVTTPRDVDRYGAFTFSGTLRGRVDRFLVDFRGRMSGVALSMPFLMLLTMRFLKFQNSKFFDNAYDFNFLKMHGKSKNQNVKNYK